MIKSKTKYAFSWISVIDTLLVMSTVLVLILFSTTGWAGTGGSTITMSAIATNVTKSVNALVTIVNAASIISGVGFVIAAFFKFHQHKNNPTQVPISHGITLILIGAGLLLFTTLLPTAGSAIFGTGAQINDLSGKAITSLLGGSPT